MTHNARAAFSSFVHITDNTWTDGTPRQTLNKDGSVQSFQNQAPSEKSRVDYHGHDAARFSPTGDQQDEN
jgi:hypothetical protein